MTGFETDVIVVGGGAAGIRAAVEASCRGADVTLVNRATVTTSGSTFSNVSRGWGIQALLDDERSDQLIEMFYNEIIDLGRGACTPELAGILVEESGARVRDLLNFGVEFKKGEDNRFFRAKGCFSEIERALITADFDKMKGAFSSILQKIGVRILTGMVIDLIISNGICAGAWVFDEKMQLLQVRAKATVMATGGGGGIYANHLCGDESTGDGCALAFRAGAPLMNLAFIQFMLGLKSNGRCRFLPRHLLYQENVLVDAAGKPVLERYLPDAGFREHAVGLRQGHCPVSTCDASYYIDRSVWQAARQTGAVYWNAAPQSSSKPEVVHMAHAFNGGIRIDATGASGVYGLFAAGECAAGPHGADRMGGCMLTATQVFGKRAGQFAAEHAAKTRHAHRDPCLQEGLPPVIKTDGESRSERERLLWMKHIIQQSMSRYAGVVRWAQGLQACRQIIRDASCQLTLMEGTTVENYALYNTVRNMADVAGQVVASAMRRETSVGPHYRRDSAMKRRASICRAEVESAA